MRVWKNTYCFSCVTGKEATAFRAYAWRDLQHLSIIHPDSVCIEGEAQIESSITQCLTGCRWWEEGTKEKSVTAVDKLFGGEIIVFFSGHEPRAVIFSKSVGVFAREGAGVAASVTTVGKKKKKEFSQGRRDGS